MSVPSFEFGASSRSPGKIPRRYPARALQVMPIALAYSRTGDQSSGEFGDAKLIQKCEVPDDLNTL